MAAHALYELLNETIDGFLEDNEDLSTFELVGVLRMITAEVEAAAITTSTEDEPED